MTSSKRKTKTYTQQFKEETVALVTDQGYSVIEADEAAGVRPNQIYDRKPRIVDEATRPRLTGEDRDGLLRLRASFYLSFNYTDSLELFYQIRNEQILYIHGKATFDDCELI